MPRRAGFRAAVRNLRPPSTRTRTVRPREFRRTRSPGDRSLRYPLRSMRRARRVPSTMSQSPQGATRREDLARQQEELSPRMSFLQVRQHEDLSRKLRFQLRLRVEAQQKVAIEKLGVLLRKPLPAPAVTAFKKSLSDERKVGNGDRLVVTIRFAESGRIAPQRASHPYERGLKFARPQI